jgi:methylmalonyl-CoA mutase C-terminal domain/subunit
MVLVPHILQLLRGNRQEGVCVFVGGIIPDEDVPRLKALGVTGVYGPGASTNDIVRDVRQALKTRLKGGK